MSLIASSWFAPKWPMSRSMACICRKTVCGELICQCVTRSLFSRNPYQCRLVAKNTSAACLPGRDFWTSSKLRKGGKTMLAGSRRRAISRRIASCWSPIAASSANFCDLLLRRGWIVGHQGQLAERLADRPALAARTAHRRGSGRECPAAGATACSRQIRRRGLENPSQRLQPPAELQAK